MDTGDTVGLSTCPLRAPRKLTNGFTYKVRMIHRNRPINEPNHNFWPPTSEFHQGWKLDQIQMVHSISKGVATPTTIGNTSYCIDALSEVFEGQKRSS